MSELKRLVDEFMANDFKNSPVTASYMGLTDYDEQLDDLSAEAFARRDVEAGQWLADFERVDEDSLDTSDAIDRDLAISALRGRLIHADWQAWRRDPVTYSGPILNGLFYLFLNRLRPTADLVDAAVARLERVPDALAAGRTNLDPSLAHPLIVERGAASARAGATYVRDMLEGEAQTTEQKERLRAAGAKAGAAFDEYVAHLDTLAKQASGEWRYGEDRYTRQLREREHIDHDARSLRDMGQAEYDRLDAEMRALAQDARGTEDWRKVLHEANDDHPATEELMRVAYDEWTQRSRQFLADTGLVTLPEGETCTVEPNPVFTRPLFAVASYSGPPAFSDSLAGHFFVPFAPEGTSEEEIQSRLGSNSHAGIPTTAVHEAYPGHHWHITWSKIHAPKLRLLLQTSFFSEGWALYTERVMRERGFFTDPVQELYHLEATIFRAARIVVDTSLHIGDMDFDEAVAYMLSSTSLTEPTARAEVGRYCSWPTQASSYLTGCLEILRIRRRYLDDVGQLGVEPKDVPVEIMRDFHDRLAGSGRLPLGLAERALLGTQSN
jgi:uncharacterized protein (DUF885 family)